MATDELIDRLSLQVDKLKTLHQELGTTSVQVQEDIYQLYDALVILAGKYVESVLEKRDAVRQQCQQTRKDIDDLKRLMGVDDKRQEPKQQSLFSTLAKLKEEKDTIWKNYLPKLDNVKELYCCLEKYHDTLGDFVNMDLIMQNNVDVSVSAITALKEEIRRCENNYAERVQQVDSGVDQIQCLWNLLDISPQSEFDHQLDQLQGCTHDSGQRTLLYAKLAQDQYLNQIMQTIGQLEDLKQQREYRKQEIIQQLHRLWDRLQPNQDTKDTFLRLNEGISESIMHQYKVELDRMLKLKSEKVQDFISDSRKEMEGLWGQLYLSQPERDTFTLFHSDSFTEALLESHEAEIERLQHLVEDRKYILEKVERFMKLNREVQEFESSTNDPKRLFGKGQRDPGRLLREEKFRKRISKELPKSKCDLVGALHEFQASTGSPFTVYGKPYLHQLIATDEIIKPMEPSQPTTPKHLKTIPKSSMTSPRHQSHAKMRFHTPQHNRVNNTKQTTSETKTEWRRLDSQLSSMTLSLHRVRQNNIRKKQQNQLANSNVNRLSKSLSIKIKGPKNDTDNQDDRRSSNSTISSKSRTTPSRGQSTLIENVAPPGSAETGPTIQLLAERHALLFEDDDVTLDLGIFDDGPELSDMSDNDI